MSNGQAHLRGGQECDLSNTRTGNQAVVVDFAEAVAASGAALVRLLVDIAKAKRRLAVDHSGGFLCDFIFKQSRNPGKDFLEMPGHLSAVRKHRGEIYFI